jgi:hypothetical protein
MDDIDEVDYENTRRKWERALAREAGNASPDNEPMGSPGGFSRSGTSFFGAHINAD